MKTEENALNSVVTTNLYNYKKPLFNSVLLVSYKHGRLDEELYSEKYLKLIDCSNDFYVFDILNTNESYYKIFQYSDNLVYINKAHIYSMEIMPENYMIFNKEQIQKFHEERNSKENISVKEDPSFNPFSEEVSRIERNVKRFCKVVNI